MPRSAFIGSSSAALSRWRARPISRSHGHAARLFSAPDETRDAPITKVPHARRTGVTTLWRAKQFEYCFIRSVTGRHADFFEVMGNALVYAAQAMKLDLPPATRERLMKARRMWSRRI
ncbi:hypothetical protein [Methylosinus sp. PW1]|uniref:hypothetical protein n=1 Tax=Methylosinus sp. PW1 TaxID=107636 RepID=UPI0018DE6952|nr:hypothetical protein [Methylosinus sp. PW1]